MAHFLPLEKEPSALETANIFIQNIFKLHGLPQKIISDRGPQFVSKVWKTVCTLMGIERALSSGYHPQTNGLTERTNYTMEQYLRCFTCATPLSWTKLLPFAEMSYNNATHSSTKMSPFYAMYARHPSFFPELQMQDLPIPAVMDWIQDIQQAQQLTWQNLEQQKQRMTTAYDKKHLPEPTLQVGDKVWLSTKYLPKGTIGHKLAPRFLGPFEVTKRINPVAYELLLPSTWKVHPVFHVSQFKPFTESSYPERLIPPPPPVVVGSEDEYEVEQIIDSRWHRRRLQYLIHWKGYPISERTWEPAEHLHATRLLKEFHAQFPEKPGSSPREETEEGTEEEHTVTISPPTLTVESDTASLNESPDSALPSTSGTPPVQRSPIQSSRGTSSSPPLPQRLRSRRALTFTRTRSPTAHRDTAALPGPADTAALPGPADINKLCHVIPPFQDGGQAFEPSASVSRPLPPD